jgi:hypothetical protein
MAVLVTIWGATRVLLTWRLGAPQMLSSGWYTTLLPLASIVATAGTASPMANVVVGAPHGAGDRLLT